MSEPGIAGNFSITVPTFLENATFFSAIDHNDPVGLPFAYVDFRNVGGAADGSPLSLNPVIDIVLGGTGFEIDALVGGPLDQVGTYTEIDNGPGDNAALTIAQVASGVMYSFAYDLTNIDQGLAGDFSFIAPDFLTQAQRFSPFSHDDPSGLPLAYVEFRNAGGAPDGTPLSQTPVLDMVLGGIGYEADTFVNGPLDQAGTYSQFGGLSTLTMSATPDGVSEPGSLLTLVGGLLVFAFRYRRPV